MKIPTLAPNPLADLLIYWAFVTVTCWFLALAVLGYIDGSIFPWNWTAQMRSYHLLVQFILIVGFAIATRPRSVRS